MYIPIPVYLYVYIYIYHYYIYTNPCISLYRYYIKYFYIYIIYIYNSIFISPSKAFSKAKVAETALDPANETAWWLHVPEGSWWWCCGSTSP